MWCTSDRSPKFRRTEGSRATIINCSKREPKRRVQTACPNGLITQKNGLRWVQHPTRLTQLGAAATHRQGYTGREASPTLNAIKARTQTAAITLNSNGVTGPTAQSPAKWKVARAKQQRRLLSRQLSTHCSPFIYTHPLHRALCPPVALSLELRRLLLSQANRTSLMWSSQPLGCSIELTKRC